MAAASPGRYLLAVLSPRPCEESTSNQAVGWEGLIVAENRGNSPDGPTKAVEIMGITRTYEVRGEQKMPTALQQMDAKHPQYRCVSIDTQRYCSYSCD